MEWLSILSFILFFHVFYLTCTENNVLLAEVQVSSQTFNILIVKISPVRQVQRNTDNASLKWDRRSLSILYYWSNPQQKLSLNKESLSCRGCALNRLPEVKAFIYEDVPKYENVEFKPIAGASPELVLFTADFQEVDRIPLSSLKRKECNQLLKEKGFKLKEIEEKEEKEGNEDKDEL